MIWWWESGCKDGWTSKLVIKFGCEAKYQINTRRRFEYMCTFITWCKLNCDEIFYIALPLLVAMSFLHQLLDFALNRWELPLRKDYFAL